MVDFKFTKENYELLLDRIGDVSNSVEKLDNRVDEGFRMMNGRVKSLETWKHRAAGFVALVGLVGGWLAGPMIKVIGEWLHGGNR